jgi:hypothetical protein
VHAANGSRGASALRKRRPFSARAASQLLLVLIMETAYHGDLVFLTDRVCLTMPRNALDVVFAVVQPSFSH